MYRVAWFISELWRSFPGTAQLAQTIIKMKQSIIHDRLWDSFKDGNKTAFGEIYQQYAPLLFDYGKKISSDNSLIEDSIQDLFVDLWNSRKKLSRTSSVKFYLFKALRYKIIRNKNISHNSEMTPLENCICLLQNSSHEDEWIKMEVASFQLKHLRDTLARLPERQREAINLRYFHNFSNEEIAGIMGINYSSACKFIYAGLKKLAENLKVSVMEVLIFFMLTCSCPGV